MTETPLVKAIRSRLQGYENVKWLRFQRNNTGAMDTEKYIRNRRTGKPVEDCAGNKLKRRSKMFFGKEGSPDFYIFFDGGVIHLECKAQGKKQDYEQQYWQESVQKFKNNYYYIVEDMAQFENVINLHKIERIKGPGNVGISER